MVRVAVLYFGVLRDLMAGSETVVELADEATVADLMKVLQRQDSSVWNSLAVAVNREYAGRGTKLQDGDEVALLPPVSGGNDAR